MKNLIFVLALFSLHANAVTVEVSGVNREPLLRFSRTFSLPSDVGQISVQAFAENLALYEGGVGGISSLFGLGQNIEVISDMEMKAHGWCFALDGLVPETMPDATPVLQQDSVVRWFYAYAHYKNGEWIGQCVED